MRKTLSKAGGGRKAQREGEGEKEPQMKGKKRVGEFVRRFEIKTAKWSDYLSKASLLSWTPPESKTGVEEGSQGMKHDAW